MHLGRSIRFRVSERQHVRVSASAYCLVEAGRVTFGHRPSSGAAVVHHSPAISHLATP